MSDVERGAAAAEVELAGERRRRRRRQSRSKWSRRRDPFRDTDFNRLVWSVMIVATLVFLGLSVKIFRSELAMLGDEYMPGASKNDTLYSFGRPRQTRPAPGGGEEWVYAYRGGGTILIDFDAASGLVRSVACEHDQPRDSACPARFHVAIGDGEDWVAYQLGEPDRQFYQGLDKQMVYADLGTTFTLREMRVRRIELGPRSGSLPGVVGRYLRTIVP